MKSFTERERGFEAEFKRTQELKFRVTARRNRLFGLWAASRLDLPAGEEAEAYAKLVVAADFEAPGDDDAINKVRTTSGRKVPPLPKRSCSPRSSAPPLKPVGR